MISKLKERARLKLKDWLGTPVDDWLKDLDDQIVEAFLYPISDIEGLQKSWNQPKTKDIDKRRKLLLNVVAGIKDGVPYWYFGGRIFNLRSNKVKPFGIWLPYEHNYVISALNGIAFPIGDKDKSETFNSEFSLHLERPFTERETELFFLQHKNNLTNF